MIFNLNSFCIIQTRDIDKICFSDLIVSIMRLERVLIKVALQLKGFMNFYTSLEWLLLVLYKFCMLGSSEVLHESTPLFSSSNLWWDSNKYNYNILFLLQKYMFFQVLYTNNKIKIVSKLSNIKKFKLKWNEGGLKSKLH